jgi:hypothetical protein
MNSHNFQIKSEWEQARAHNSSEKEDVEEAKEKGIGVKNIRFP